MAEAAEITERTEEFIEQYLKLKKSGELPDNKELAIILGMKSASTISNILGRRQNIKGDSWRIFKATFGKELSESPPNDDSEEKEPTPMQILDRLSRAFVDQAAGFRAQAETIKNIENNMARREVLANVESSLVDAAAVLDKLSIGQNGGLKRIFDEFEEIKGQISSLKAISKRKD